MERNLFLIGFMGTGKSTVAARMKEALLLELIEMDEELVRREGMSISELFKTKGEPYFRDAETQLIYDIQKKSGCIVSCGGGVVMRQQNVDAMREKGKIVLLTAEPETVYERVKDSNARPLLNGRMNVEAIRELMEQRREAYERAADIRIATDGKTAEQIVEEIREKIR